MDLHWKPATTGGTLKKKQKKGSKDYRILEFQPDIPAGTQLHDGQVTFLYGLPNLPARGDHGARFPPAKLLLRNLRWP